MVQKDKGHFMVQERSLVCLRFGSKRAKKSGSGAKKDLNELKKGITYVRQYMGPEWQKCPDYGSG